MDWDGGDEWEDPLHRANIQVIDIAGVPAFSFHLPPGLPPLADDDADQHQMAIEEGLEPLTCAEVESTLRQRFRALLPYAMKMALPREFLNQLFPQPSEEQKKEAPEEKLGEEEEGEEEEEKSQRYARAPSLSNRWLVGALRWLFLASQDNPQAGLAWLLSTATQPGERHDDGDVEKERAKEWCLMASAVLGHIESAMHAVYAAPRSPIEYIARHTDLLADSTQLESWIKRACQAQRAEVLPYLLRCLSALGCVHETRRTPEGEDSYVQLVLECIRAPLQPTNKPAVIKAGLHYLGMPRSGFINEMLQDLSDELEQSIINLIDHPEIEVRTALLPLLCSHRLDFSDDVLLKRLASLKDETHIPILTHTLSALSQALSLDRLIDHSQDLFEVAMRALGHEDRKVVYSAAELLELSLDFFDAESDRNASEALVWLVRALVDVVWKPRAIKSLLALSVKCVRANLDKLKPLVPVLPHELQQRINPLEVKVHDTLGVADQKLWWSRPHDAATHCLNILVTTYPHCFTELAKIVDEYLEPEQPWRKREVGLFLLQCARDEGDYNFNDAESVEELMIWADGHLPLVVDSLSHPHPQIRKVSCLTIERKYAAVIDEYNDVLGALWRIASDDPVDVAEAAISCINELLCTGALSQATYEEGLERLVDICRKRPSLAEQILRTMIGLIPLRVAADVWISAVVPLCLELIETSLDADTLRTTFECLAEILLYNYSSLGLGGHKEAITRLLERLSARPEDQARGVRLMDALQRAKVGLSLFAAPDAIVAFAASVLQSQRPSVHKLSHLLDHMTVKHPEAVQRALPQLVPAVVTAIYHTHYDPSKWYHMITSINEWLHSFPEEMTPHIESLSACLARVSPAIGSDKYRAAMINAIGLMGFRHAHLVSPAVLRIFPANWLRSAHIFGIKYPDPSWRNRAPESPPLPWEEAAEGLANVIERLCTTAAATDSAATDAASEPRYSAAVALAALIKEVLDTMRSLGALQGALRPRLRERLAAAVAAVTGGWSRKQQKAFVRQYWTEESNDREDYKELLREFLPDIHPLVVLLNRK